MTEGRVERRRSKGLRLYLVERRKGKAWMYGSIVLCVVLLSYLATLVFR